NKSCDPNCEVQAWNVAGYTRVGIFTRMDLQVDAALCYDYKVSVHWLQGV
ncbi:unnamed protein product, partial [Discosporangium mesarthrocarpum]